MPYRLAKGLLVASLAVVVWLYVGLDTAWILKLGLMGLLAGAFIVLALRLVAPGANRHRRRFGGFG